MISPALMVMVGALSCAVSLTAVCTVSVMNPIEVMPFSVSDPFDAPDVGATSNRKLLLVALTLSAPALATDAASPMPAMVVLDIPTKLSAPPTELPPPPVPLEIPAVPALPPISIELT